MTKVTSVPQGDFTVVKVASIFVNRNNGKSLNTLDGDGKGYNSSNGEALSLPCLLVRCFSHRHIGLS